MIIIGETGNLVLLQNCIDVFVIHIDKNIDKDEKGNSVVKKVNQWCVCCTTLLEKNLKLGTYSTEEQAERHKKEILNILALSQPIYTMPEDEGTKENKQQEE